MDRVQNCQQMSQEIKNVHESIGTEHTGSVGFIQLDTFMSGTMLHIVCANTFKPCAAIALFHFTCLYFTTLFKFCVYNCLMQWHCVTVFRT